MASVSPSRVVAGVLIRGGGSCYRTGRSRWGAGGGTLWHLFRL